MRQEFEGLSAGWMPKSPVASCRFGVLNQRNAKQALRAHSREFHRGYEKCNVKVDSKNGFGFSRFPEQDEGLAPGGETKGMVGTLY